jgi:hypothetical protein
MLLFYCRAGFEADCAAELTAAALGAGADDVAALDVGPDVFESRSMQAFRKVSHRQDVVPANVHTSQ